MRRLLEGVRLPDVQDIGGALVDYREILEEWNESVGPINVQLTLLINRGASIQFESEIHNHFVVTGRMIERTVRARQAGREPDKDQLAKAQQALDNAQARLYRFNSMVLNELKRRRETAYLGVKLPYDRWHIEKYSTWDLIKSLFIRNVDSYAVFGSPLDASLPEGGR